jgi:hypothetical protein
VSDAGENMKFLMMIVSAVAVAGLLDDAAAGLLDDAAAGLLDEEEALELLPHAVSTTTRISPGTHVHLV